jgi:type II secretory pathway pseudopilin PulG
MNNKTSGFSLLELAIVVLILGMMTTLLWPFISARLQKQEAMMDRSLLARAELALMGFVMANDRLPCPASNHLTGEEDCADANKVGTLPWKALGIADVQAARQVRYGVLRRTADADPESTADAPFPGGNLALSRVVDLTQAEDRFYPLIGILTGTNLAGETSVSVPALAINSSLSPSSRGRGEDRGPVTSWTDLSEKRVLFGKANALDFCWMLRVAEASPPTPGFVDQNIHMELPGGKRQLAYGLALPDAKNTDPRVFQPPRNLADAQVRAATPGVLWARLGCGEALATVGHAQANLATAATLLYRGFFDYEQTLEQAYWLAEAQYEMSGGDNSPLKGSVLSASSKVVGAAAGLLKLIGGAIGGEATSGLNIAKGVVSTVLAATAVTLAWAGNQTSGDSYELAWGRYSTARAFKYSAGAMAQDLLNRAREADRTGLFGNAVEGR